MIATNRFNAMRSEHTDHHFAGNICKSILLKKFGILIKIYLKFSLVCNWKYISMQCYPLKRQSNKYIHEPNFVFTVPTQTPTASSSARPLAGTEPNGKFVWFLASFVGILPLVLYFVDRAWRY